MKVEELFEVPPGEKFVAMVQHKDHLFIATNHHLYRVSEADREADLVPLSFQQDEGGD